jgi:hypothetical protein
VLKSRLEYGPRLKKSPFEAGRILFLLRFGGSKYVGK